MTAEVISVVTVVMTGEVVVTEEVEQVAAEGTN
jgi:hypothetical protein